MTKEDQDLTLYQGAAKVVTIPIVDADGQPVNMTGGIIYYGVFTSKAAAGTGVALIAKNRDAGGVGEIALVNSAGTADAMRITIDESDTNGLLPGRYYHEARLTLDGKPAVVFEGRLRLKRSITATSS